MCVIPLRHSFQSATLPLSEVSFICLPATWSPAFKRLLCNFSDSSSLEEPVVKKCVSPTNDDTSLPSLYLTSLINASAILIYYFGSPFAMLQTDHLSVLFVFCLQAGF